MAAAQQHVEQDLTAQPIRCRQCRLGSHDSAKIPHGKNTVMRAVERKASATSVCCIVVC
jgi:hypothetical protein